MQTIKTITLAAIAATALGAQANAQQVPTNPFALAGGLAGPAVTQTVVTLAIVGGTIAVIENNDPSTDTR